MIRNKGYIMIKLRIRHDKFVIKDVLRTLTLKFLKSDIVLKCMYELLAQFQFNK